MITGCASTISQAVALGYFPPVKIIHTSKKVFGQIYVPTINYVLAILTILVRTFNLKISSFR